MNKEYIKLYRDGYRARYGVECSLADEKIERLIKQFETLDAELDEDPVLSAMADAQG